MQWVIRFHFHNMCRATHWIIEGVNVPGKTQHTTWLPSTYDTFLTRTDNLLFVDCKQLNHTSRLYEFIPRVSSTDTNLRLIRFKMKQWFITDLIAYQDSPQISSHIIEKVETSSHSFLICSKICLFCSQHVRWMDVQSTKIRAWCYVGSINWA
jgi:hypothetical protein